MSALASLEMPSDVQLVLVTKAAAALDMDPRKLKRLAGEQGLRLVQFGERGLAMRLSDVRRLIAKHEVPPCS